MTTLKKITVDIFLEDFIFLESESYNISKFIRGIVHDNISLLKKLKRMLDDATQDSTQNL